MSEDFLVYLEYASAKSFITVLKALGNLVDEALFNFTSEGLKVKAIDPAQIALISITLPSDSFLEYRVDREVGVGVNVNNLLKTLPAPKKGDKLIMRAGEEFYEVILEGVTTKRYKYRSIEVSASEIPEIELDFKVRALVMAKSYTMAIKDLKGAGTLIFEVNDDQYFHIKAPELNAEAKLSRLGGSIIDMEVKEASRTGYDEDYLARVLNIGNVAETLEIKFGNEIPAYLSFSLVEGGSVEYLLAPKA